VGDSHQVTLRYCNAETPSATATYRPVAPYLADRNRKNFWPEQPTVTPKWRFW